MKKLDALNQVKEFHKTFDVPVLKNPEIPSKARCELRISLIQEELNELKEAIENNGKFIVYRKDDNKVLKSINYSPADLKKIVENESQKV